MLHRQAKVGSLRRALGKLYQSADQVNVACHCPDPKCATATQNSKLKLAVHLADGRYHCWVCGIKGGNISWLVKRFRNNHFEEVSRAFPSNRPKLDDEEQHEIEAVVLPPGFHLMAQNLDTTIPEYRAVIQYVKDRGFTDDDIWRYKLGFSNDELYVNRLIIPSFNASGELNFFMSRAISKWTYPRYRNASTKKHTMVFNELDVDWSKELVLTEGAFDALNCPINATCLLGNSMNDRFLIFRRIVENGTPVILALDAEEKQKTKKLAKLLYSFDIHVRVMSLDGYKDLGEMPRDEIMKRIATAGDWSPASALMERISNLSVGIPSGSLIE